MKIKSEPKKMNNLSHRGKEKQGARLGAQLSAQLEEKITRFARVPHYVLITGERGSGKTTIARRLHERSARAKREFINLNCANLNKELLESELFGYEKGAFTGAAAPKAGLFEIAGGGTLFLDEIGEIPLGLQAKLLKAVEEKHIRRVGGNRERAVDTRIIAATSADLEKMVEKGSFRADLYDRLNILNIETVPLRFQKEKIKELLRTGLKMECEAVGRTRPFEISDEAFALLENYDWRGNFRELLNFATRLSVECLDEKVISAAAIRRILGERINHSNGSQAPRKAERSLAEYDFRSVSTENLITVTFDPKTDDLAQIYLKAAGNVISHVLSETGGNLRRAARILGADHSTLSRILTKFNARCESRNFPISSSAEGKAGAKFARAAQGRP